MSTKLDEIAGLRDGWWGPGSRSVGEQQLEVVRQALGIRPSLVHGVSIGPLPSGSVMLEWERGNHVYTAEIEASGSMELTEDDVETDEFVSRTVPADPQALLSFMLGGVQ